MSEEYLEELRRLKERLLRLRREKASLLSMLDDLEEDGEAEAQALEREIAELQLILDAKAAKKRAREEEVVFRF